MGTLRTPSLLTLGLLALALGGCGQDPAPRGQIPRAPTGARIDDHRWLGEPLLVGNLTVWPVHTDRPLDVGEFLTLEEAEGRGVAAVREVGGGTQGANDAQVLGDGRQDLEIVDADDPGGAADNDAAEPDRERIQELIDAVQGQVAGQQRGRIRQIGQARGGAGAQVNTLVIENDGDLPILVCAGTIVKGGRQDRQIGQDFVIAAKTSVPVDAFCVEQGRWQARDGDVALGVLFSSSGQGIAIKSVRSGAQYENDQGKVWSEVGKVLKDQSISGTTTLVAANEEVDAAVQAQRAALERRIVEHFAALARGASAPVGFAYAVDGKPVTVRAFAHERLLRGHLPAFVKAMCLEAELAAQARGAEVEPPPATAADVVALVRTLRAAREREQRTSASNWNAYRTTDAGFSGECRIQLEGRGPDKVIVTEDWTAR